MSREAGGCEGGKGDEGDEGGGTGRKVGAELGRVLFREQGEHARLQRDQLTRLGLPLDDEIAGARGRELVNDPCHVFDARVTAGQREEGKNASLERSLTVRGHDEIFQGRRRIMPGLRRAFRRSVVSPSFRHRPHSGAFRWARRWIESALNLDPPFIRTPTAS